jgi:hypothetical protein
LEKGVFEVAFNVLKRVCIFNFKFVNEMKNKGTEKAFAKLRLVV